MPDFRLETEMTDNLELKEIIDSDEELSQALQAIEEVFTLLPFFLYLLL
jgi:hypothetical protein